jgi:HSP20 family molecular chaperone IbpA
MARIEIKRCEDRESIPEAVSEQARAITEAIRRRAYDLFQSRKDGNGSDLEDWLQAEREVAWVPASELVEGDTEIRARIALPGFDAKEIEVSAMPDALVVRADATHSHEGKSGKVCFCEFSHQKLFRRLDLPAPIDVDKVSASLDKGILQVVAPKAAKKQMAAAA